MDQRERIEDQQDALRAVLRGFQSNLWTALPAIVVSFDGNTVTATPAIKAKARTQAGSLQDVQLPQLIHCPVVFPSGGGYALTFPLGAGDEVLMVFASRCIDAWWQSGGVQSQIELRLHNLSDGFAIPGPLSKPRALANVNSQAVQLRTFDGTYAVTMNESAKTLALATPSTSVLMDEGAKTITLSAPTTIKLEAPVVQMSGVIEVLNTGAAATAGTVSGTLQATGDLVAGQGGGDQVSVQQHVHGGVQPGAGQTSAPVAGT